MLSSLLALTEEGNMQGKHQRARKSCKLAHLKWQHAITGVDKAAAAAWLHKPEQGNAQGVEDNHEGPDLQLQAHTTSIVSDVGWVLMLSCHASFLISLKPRKQHLHSVPRTSV